MSEHQLAWKINPQVMGLCLYPGCAHENAEQASLFYSNLYTEWTRGGISRESVQESMLVFARDTRDGPSRGSLASMSSDS
jgi:hypothetical protein